MALTLLSTVVAPAFTAGSLDLSPRDGQDLVDLLSQVDRNLCGHPATNAMLRAVCPTLPAPERAFWDGSSIGLAVRPKGGVRGTAAAGDTQVSSLSDLEAVLVKWRPW